MAPPAQGVLVLLQKMWDLKMGWKKSFTREGERYYKGDNWVGGDGRMDFAAYQLRLSGANRESGWNGTPAPI